jgi:hypothetical protein
LRASGGQGVAVLIVSEPSAEAARRVRTRRSSPVRSRSSATHNDTPRHSDARPISVHTEVLTRDLRPLRSPRDRPTSAHRHQGRRSAASLAQAPSATLDPGNPTQRQPGMREWEASRSSPPVLAKHGLLPGSSAVFGHIALVRLLAPVSSAMSQPTRLVAQPLVTKPTARSVRGH